MTEDRKPDWPPTVGLTVEDCAAALRVSEDAVRAAIKHGGLPARRIGKGYRIDVDALKAWLANADAEDAQDQENL